MLTAIVMAMVVILGAGPTDQSPGSGAPAMAVACFNDSDDDGNVGVWVYEGHSDWRVARRDPKSMLVFGFRPGRGEYSEADLEYCWYAVSVQDHEIVLCESGDLTITSLDPPRSIAGRYAFSLQNGTKKKGDFSASYCPGKE